MSKVWARVKKLEGATLNSLVQQKLLCVIEPAEYRLWAVPDERGGTKRMIYRAAE